MDKVYVTTKSSPGGATSVRATPFTASEKATNTCSEQVWGKKGMGKVGMKPMN